MLSTNDVQFGQIRTETLLFWLNETGRYLIELDTSQGKILIDDFPNGQFECQWQTAAWTLQKDDEWHVSHFCSLGDWASNITDMLTDPRYDDIHFVMGANYDQTEYDQVLFRYYTKFMLVVSELLTDFADLLVEACICSNQIDARNKLSTPDLNVHNLFEYINSVCKHKVRQSGRNSTKLHACNHHLPFFFEDSNDKAAFTNPIRVSNVHNIVQNPDGIIVPKLSSLVAVIVNGYQVLDNEFQNDPPKFEAFISDHGKHLP